MKKVAQIFGRFKNFLYLCSVGKKQKEQNKFNSKKQSIMTRGRKGSVYVNGMVMTGERYSEAILKTIKELTKKPDVWVSGNTIVEHASNQLKMERINAKRKAHSHPIFKHLSELWYDGQVLRRKGLRGKYEYRLNK